MRFFNLGLLSLLTMFSGRTEAGDLVTASLHGDPRPFRAGIMRLNPQLDAEKTLGLSDGVGWTVSGDLLIGAPDGKSVAAFSLQGLTPVWWRI